MIFHIARAEDWRAAQADGAYRISTLGLSLEEVGFIHCSQGHQVAGVAAAYYAGVPDLVLLHIDPSRVQPEIRDEAVGSDGETFPHIYGPLNLDAVVEVEPFTS